MRADLVFTRADLVFVEQSMKITSVYKLYNKYDELLYVGISLSAITRLSQHKADKEWYSEISRVDIEHYETEEQARDVEGILIKELNPRYNVVRPGCARRHPDLMQTLQERLNNSMDELLDRTVNPRSKQIYWDQSHDSAYTILCAAELIYLIKKNKAAVHSTKTLVDDDGREWDFEQALYKVNRMIDKCLFVYYKPNQPWNVYPEEWGDQNTENFYKSEKIFEVSSSGEPVDFTYQYRYVGRELQQEIFCEQMNDKESGYNI
jgi:predicted GIY-YIG superfamily endonuclease